MYPWLAVYRDANGPARPNTGDPLTDNRAALDAYIAANHTVYGLTSPADAVDFVQTHQRTPRPLDGAESNYHLTIEPPMPSAHHRVVRFEQLIDGVEIDNAGIAMGFVDDQLVSFSGVLLSRAALVAAHGRALSSINVSYSSASSLAAAACTGSLSEPYVNRAFLDRQADSVHYVFHCDDQVVLVDRDTASTTLGDIALDAGLRAWRERLTTFRVLEAPRHQPAHPTDPVSARIGWFNYGFPSKIFGTKTENRFIDSSDGGCNRYLRSDGECIRSTVQRVIERSRSENGQWRNRETISRAIGMRAFFYAIANVSGSQGVEHFLTLMKDYILNIQTDFPLDVVERGVIDGLFLHAGI